MGSIAHDPDTERAGSRELWHLDSDFCRRGEGGAFLLVRCGSGEAGYARERAGSQVTTRRNLATSGKSN